MQKEWQGCNNFPNRQKDGVLSALIIEQGNSMKKEEAERGLGCILWRRKEFCHRGTA